MSFLQRTNSARVPRWVTALGLTDARGRYKATPQADEATSSLIRRTTSLDDLEATAHHEPDVDKGAARRNRSVGAKPNQSSHSADDSITYAHWQDIALTRLTGAQLLVGMIVS